MRADAVFRLDRPEVIRAPDGEPRVAHAINEYSDVFREVLHHPKLLDPVTQIISEPYYLSSVQGGYQKPFGRNNLPWHTDLDLGRGRYPGGLLAITVGVFLERVTKFNGPLLFIPGSHLETNVQFHRATLQEETDGTVLALRASLRVLIDPVRYRQSPRDRQGTIKFCSLTGLFMGRVHMTPHWRHILYMSANPSKQRYDDRSIRVRGLKRFHATHGQPAVVAGQPNRPAKEP